VNEPEVKALVEQMFDRHQRAPKPEWVAELTAEILTCSCHACAKGVIKSNMDEGPAPLTVPRFRQAFRIRLAGEGHSPHIMQTDREYEVSEVERFWRHDAVLEVERALPDREPLGHELIAALMWMSEAVPAQASHVADEFVSGAAGAPKGEATNTIWANAATTAIMRVGGLTRELVDMHWAAGRMIATLGHKAWWEAEQAAGRV